MKRLRMTSVGLPPAGSQVVMKSPAKSGFFLVKKKKTEKRKPVLFVDRTIAKGLSFPQANTFPPGQVVKLHYNIVSSLTSTSGGTFMPEVFYRLNSLYDPAVAVGGGQPYYYDTLFGANGTSAPYRQYRVIKSKIDVQFYNDNTASGSAQMAGVGVGLDLNSTAGTVAASQLMMQRPHTRIVPVPVMNNGQAVSGFTVYVDHAELLGIKDIKDADDQVAAYNANPSGAEISVGVFMFPIDSTAPSTTEMWYRLHITYTVECRTLNTVTES